MKVFISWSGETSKAVATDLHDWIPNVLQFVEPWISNHDIPSGSRWTKQLGEQLQELKTGILCLTADNLNSPWILFEAGALAKTLDDSLVCPYLFKLEPTEVEWPLAQFQLETASEEGTRKLLTTVNNAADKDRLSDARFKASFEMWWPKLKEKLDAITLPTGTQRTVRSPQELLEEVLETVRTIAKTQALQWPAVSEMITALGYDSSGHLHRVNPNRDVLAEGDLEDIARLPDRAQLQALRKKLQDALERLERK